jgi:hypothetical protein
MPQSAKPKNNAVNVTIKKKKQTPAFRNLSVNSQMTGFVKERAVSAPSAHGTLSTRNVANFRFAHCERLATVTTGSASSGVWITQIINPGLISGTTNGLLARQAALYEMYVLKRLRFVYHPVVGTGTTGNVVIGADVGANDSPPTDAYGMTNLSLGYSEGNVWTKVTYDVDCSVVHRNVKSKYVRTLPATYLGSGATNYDAGIVYIWSEGTPANTTIGYIDVEYDIEFIGVNRNTNFAENIAQVGLAEINIVGTDSAVSVFTGIAAPVKLWAPVVAPTGAPISGAFNAVVSSTGAGTNNVSVSGGNVVLQPGYFYRLKLNTVVLANQAGNGLMLVGVSGSPALLCNTHVTGVVAAATYAVQTSAISENMIYVSSSSSPTVLGISNFYLAGASGSKGNLALLTSDQEGLPSSSLVVEVYQSGS